MRVVVYGPLRAATGEKTVEVDFEGGTVGEALAALVEQYPGANEQLFDDEGTLHPSVRVLRDGDRVTPDAPCTPTDELALFPAVQGGQDRRGT